MLDGRRRMRHDWGGHCPCYGCQPEKMWLLIIDMGGEVFRTSGRGCTKASGFAREHLNMAY